MFSTYVRLAGEGENSEPNAAFLVNNLRNNAPDCVPNWNIATNRKREVLKHWKVQPPEGETYSSQPIIALPEGIDIHFGIAARKLLRAIYYKETRQMVGSHHRLFTKWSQLQIPSAREALESIQKYLPGFVLGQRRNTSLGRQFVYSWGWDKGTDVFGLFVVLDQSICILGGLAPDGLEPDMMDDDWAYGSHP